MTEVEAAREAIAAGGPEALVIDDLRRADLDHLGWSGDALHLRSVEHQLERVERGEVDYLVTRSPGGTPIAKAGIDLTAAPGYGVIWQLATHPDLQGRGLGARLIRACEARIRARGIPRASLAVELDNPRARALYERLGYELHGERETGWEVDGPDGEPGWHSTVVVDLVRLLS